MRTCYPPNTHQMGTRLSAEIYTDEHGRVKVKFPWDRHSQADENASCWVRVSHASSGMNYGHASIPRMGSEVVVQYLGGDIDQPIITGMAYNPTKKHAYDLPQNKTRSYWKDKTHKGDGFNEIRFESEKGNEEIFVHAERDISLAIERNRTELVGGHRSTIVDKTANEIVQIAKSSVTGLSETKIVGKSFAMKVGFGVGQAPVLSALRRKSMAIFDDIPWHFRDNSSNLPVGYTKEVQGDDVSTTSGHSSEAVGGE